MAMIDFDIRHCCDVIDITRESLRIYKAQKANECVLSPSFHLHSFLFHFPVHRPTRLPASSRSPGQRTQTDLTYGIEG